MAAVDAGPPPPARRSKAGQGESPRALAARLVPIVFDPEVDPILTLKTPGAGRDILESSANNLYADVSLRDLDGFRERHPLNSRLVKISGQLVEEVYRVGGRYDREIRRIIRTSRTRCPMPRFHGRGAPRVDSLLHHGRGRRSRGLRHRVGARRHRHGGHRQRIRGGLPGPPRRQGRVGGHRLVHQRRQDATHRDDSGARPVVRTGDAVGGPLQADRSDGRVSPRHRRRDRNRRLRADYAGRHQPAQRPGGPRAVR
jgi:hypothetical protein